MVPDYAIVEPDLDPYSVHEAMQRLILREIWRLRESQDSVNLHDKQRAPKPVPSEGHSSAHASAYARRTADALGEQCLLYTRVPRLSALRFIPASALPVPATVDPSPRTTSMPKSSITRRLRARPAASTGQQQP